MEFQSTHPRRVWLANHLSSSCYWNVSIHTPTKGVTPRPLWRYCYQQCFNPHTHEGCDSEATSHGRIDGVSIHTPTKGVTWLPTRSVLCFLFQSTHPRRVWQGHRSLPSRCSRFNPHTHEGCDDSAPSLVGYWCGFNPHTHEGCDQSGRNPLPVH